MAKPTLKQREDGRYRCKYKGLYFYGYSPSEAFAARDRYKLEESQGIHQKSVISVGDYASAWLPTHKANVSRKTYNDYARYVNVLITSIGERPLKEVTASDIKSVFSENFLGYSESAIHKARMLYIAIWDTALEDGYANKNPCRAQHARPHKGTVGSHRALTKEEDAAILDSPANLRLAVLVMRYAGLRRGEVLALDIDRDVDFENHVIHVREAIHYDSNQPTVGSTKSIAGQRDVPLFKILENELKGHHGLVAPSASGKIMSKTAFVSAWRSYLTQVETHLNGLHKRWYGRTKEHKMILAADGTLPGWITFRIQPHDLRHSFCTMLRDSGIEMKLAMQWMGHADEKMILRIYDHVTEDRTARAIQAIESSLSPQE